MLAEENQIGSLEECKKYFIHTHLPTYVKHIEDFMGMAKHNEYQGRVGVLLKKYITNAFGFEDNRYYYLVYRKDGWFKGWASENNANVTKYMNKPGCSVSSRIFASMELNDKYRNLGVLVIGFGDKSFHYVKCTDIVKFVRRYGTLFTSRWDQLDIGLAAEITQETDPFGN